MIHSKSVIIFLPNLNSGGAERVSVTLAREWSLNGFDVTFLLMQESGRLLSEVKEEFNVVVLNITRMRSLLPRLIPFLRENRYSVFFVSMWPLTFLAPLSAILAGFKGTVIVSEHNSLSIQYANRGRLHYWSMRLSMALGYRLANSVVSVSSGVANELCNLAWFPRSRIHVIHNPIHVDERVSAVQLELANKAWGADTTHRLLSVGSLKSQKNHDLLIRAFAKLNLVQARLLILGEGELLFNLIDLTKKLGVQDRVTFLGFCSNPSPFYKTANLLVVSSNYEGFCNVIVEALAHGLPVVSTDCSFGPSEILSKGEFGRLVPVDDENSLVDAILKSLSAEKDENILIMRAKEFSPKVVIRKYLKLM